MSSTPHTIRVPSFMAASRAKASVVTTLFAVPADARASELGPSIFDAPAPAAPTVAAPVAIFASIETPAQTVAALERQMAETAARVELAIERLRATGERLAAEARADALEIAMVVARRIVETELSENLGAQVAFIRAAVKRLGETRTVTIRLTAAQAAALGQADAPPLGLGAATTAHLEIVADPSLARGDCVVEGDFGAVDGRVSSRLEEVRRVVLASLDQEVA